MIYKTCFQKLTIGTQWITLNCNYCWCVVTSHGDECLQTWIKTSHRNSVFADTSNLWLFCFSMPRSANIGYHLTFKHSIILVKKAVQIKSLLSNSLFCLGKTLLWVAVLGIAVVYIFALGAFAMLRSTINPSPDGDVHLFCGTLWQCLLTMIRYGFIGELFEVCVQG